ncbi:hypothetical protein [Micromonospora sp. NPDC005174]|uniref:hypothetical protein n=1 Tax=Micromonospora sp. NPDC005174 TaxID=3157018 RepID=UPI0033A7FB20
MSTSEFSPDSLRTLIRAGAWIGGPDTRKAAVHLLTSTKLPDQPGFADLVDVVQIPEYDDGHDIQVAVIRDWPALLALPAVEHLSDDDRRLLALAGSLATGQPVDLATNAAVEGHEHAAKVAEAMVIAAGYHMKYEVNATERLTTRFAKA